MAKDGIGSDLWKSVQAIKVGRDTGIEVPVRASSRQGIVVGADAVAKSDASNAPKTTSPPGRVRALWNRVRRH